MGRCVTRPEDEAAWSLFGYSDGRRTKTDGAEAGRPHLTESVAARLGGDLESLNTATHMLSCTLFQLRNPTSIDR
jgi:hypothetical protein